MGLLVDLKKRLKRLTTDNPFLFSYENSSSYLWQAYLYGLASKYSILLRVARGDSYLLQLQRASVSSKQRAAAAVILFLLAFSHSSI
jgi:hypothetical protein